METKTRLRGLDHLRAFAITLVFLFHYGHLFPHPAWINTTGKFGWTGVDLFFVLSGYLIASQLFAEIAARKTISLKTFYLKRAFRIIPAYLVVVGVYFCFPWCREREALAPLWKYLAFVQNLGLDLRTQGTFSHAWSLCIEEQFYLFLPAILCVLVYFKAIKRAWFLLLLLFLSGLVIRYYSYQVIVNPLLNNDGGWAYWYEWIYYPTWCRLDGLLAGVSIAAVFQFRPLLKERICSYGNMLTVLGIAILAIAYFACLNELSFNASVFGFPLVAVGYGLIVTGAISPGSFAYNINSKITASIATLSYSIYLIHKILIHIAQETFGKMGIDKEGLPMFFICIIVCLAGAVILNTAVEKPFLKLERKTVKKK